MNESDEQILLSDTLDLMKIPHYSLRNEESIKSMGYLMKRKRMGWRSGLPDLMVIIPSERSYVGRTLLLFIEMKKARRKLLRASERGQKGDMVTQNSPTVEQLQFIDQVNEVSDVQGYIAHSCSEALAIIDRLIVHD